MSGDEIWLPVLDFEDTYEVSNFGRVKSLKRQVRTANGFRTVRERILKPQYNQDGSQHVSLCNGGEAKIRHVQVHRLVLEAFVGECPEGMECRHYPDQNLANNNLSNLSWATPGRTKLTEEQVRQIFYAKGTHEEVAARFGIGRPEVSHIKSGKLWKHLSLAVKESTTRIKLTEEQVRQIFFATGTYREIAARFGRSRGAVGAIKTGKAWTNLNLLAPKERRMMSNNTTGHTGVQLRKYSGKYQVHYNKDGKRYYFGSYDTVEEAAEAYRIGSEKLRGDFSHRELEWEG
jgi:hypothetical protein